MWLRISGVATFGLATLLVSVLSAMPLASNATANALTPRSESVFSGPSKVSVGPAKARCKLTLRTTLRNGAVVQLQFHPRSFIMPWESEEPPDTWRWRSVARVVVKGGRVTHTLKISTDGYWRYSSARGSSDPRFIDVYPTSDLSDPGIPGYTTLCRR